MTYKYPLLPLLSALLALPGCIIVDPPKDEPRPIAFSATAGSSATRTSYSGVDENGNPVDAASARERIDWTDGDLIAIYCAQAVVDGDATLHLADYRVTSHKELDNARSQATLAPTGEDLIWGNGSHTFQAMYPSPSTEAFTDAERAKIGVNGTAMRGTIPAAQTVTWDETTGQYQPEMQYAYLYAHTSANPGYPVSLSFEPAYSAFSFSISAGPNAAVDITSFTMTTSASGKALAGDFSIPTATPDDESTRTFSNTSPSLTVDFTTLPGGKLVLDPDTPVTFTVLALPQTLTGIRISFTGPTCGTRSVSLTDGSGNSLTFLPGCKARIYGLSFPALTSAGGENLIWDGSAEGEGILWADGSAHGKGITWDVPEGVSSPKAIFSVSDDKKVYFSKGNLQLVGDLVEDFDHEDDLFENYHFIFAPRQWEYRTVDNMQDAGILQLDYFTPWLSGWFGNDDDFDLTILELYLFGLSFYLNSYDTDKYSLQYRYMTDWRTLGWEEWQYLLGNGEKRDGQYGTGQVEGVNGLFLLPDKDVWELPDGLTFVPYEEGLMEANRYTAAEWNRMQAAGAVFFPAVGYYDTGTSEEDDKMMESGTMGVYYIDFYTQTQDIEDGSDDWHLRVLVFADGYMQMASTNSDLTEYGANLRFVRDIE